ncbi:MarR family transcriptional regulator [Streptomyces sp. NPDC050856]|uniref:MarR family transcriptional regulator n=1 Tax=Streptomyces sp. NPDC050856 TaxID=3154939 RepID=UPI0033D2D4B0
MARDASEPGAAEVVAALLALWEHADLHTPTTLPRLALRALMVLERAAPLSPGELADALAISAASASRLSARLEAAGLLVRQAVPGDRRKVSLRPTPAGLAAVAELRARLARAVAPALVGADAGRGPLRSALAQVRDRLRRLLSTGHGRPW